MVNRSIFDEHGFFLQKYIRCLSHFHDATVEIVEKKRKYHKYDFLQ